jgi:lipopolysaccharide exporter
LLRLQPKLGLGYAFVQRNETTGETVGTYAAMEAAAGFAGLLLSLLAVPVLAALGYSHAVVTLSVALAAAGTIESLSGIGSTLLDRELLFRASSLVQSLAFPVSYAPAFWLATHGGGAWSLVAQTLTLDTLVLAGIGWTVRRRLPHLWTLRWHFSRSLARQFLRFGLTVGLSVLASLLLGQLDNLWVGTFLGVGVLGFYDRAYRTAQVPALMLNSLVTRASFYTYTRLQDDMVRLQKTVTMILWLVFTAALPAALVGFVTAPDLLTLLYGPRWLPSAPMLRILVLVFALRPFWDNSGTLFIAIGKPRLSTIFTVVQAATLAITGVPLTLAFGAIGTCAAVGLAAAMGILLVYRNVTREIRIDLRAMLGPPLLAAALTLGGYLALSRLVDLNALPIAWRTAAKAAYTIVAFLTLSFAMQPRTMRERWQYIWQLTRQSAGR